MKIQCDVCEKAQATVICCADEAALCSKCDVEVHAANKLASKHQRLLLQCLSNKLPPCDVCQEKAAFIFCVEDRALFCKDCDEPIHSANTRAANHQRFLATGIRVALSSSTCNNKEIVENKKSEPKPPKPKSQQHTPNASGLTSKSWTVDELLQFSEFESSNKKEQLEFNELDWFSGINFYNEEVSQEALAAAEVPQLPVTSSHNHYTSSSYNNSSDLFYGAHKKPRLELPCHNDDDDEDYLTVPDLG